MQQKRLGKLPCHVIGKIMPACIAPCFNNPKLQEPLLTMSGEWCHFFHCFFPRTCWHPPLKPATCSHIAVVPPIFLLYNQISPGFAPEASWNLMQATSQPLPEKGPMKTIKLQALGVCDVQLSAWPSGDLNLPSAFVPHSCPRWPQQILRVGSSSASRFL